MVTGGGAGAICGGGAGGGAVLTASGLSVQAASNSAADRQANFIGRENRIIAINSWLRRSPVRAATAQMDNKSHLNRQTRYTAKKSQKMTLADCRKL